MPMLRPEAHVQLQSLSLLIPLVIVTALYASLLKLAARMLGLNGVSWSRAFGFAILIVLLSTLVRVASTYMGLSTQTIAGLILGLTVHLAFGAWFFRARASDRAGNPVGWIGAAKLSAIAIGFLILAVAALMGAASVLVRTA